MNTHRVLVIDNQDSFVHTLADEFSRRGYRCDVYRNHWATAEALQYLTAVQPRLVLLSPGPGGPAAARLCLDVLSQADPAQPIFGVCLGLQCIVTHFGGRVGQCTERLHGKASTISHGGRGLFAGLSNPMQAGRYHSLVGLEVPHDLVVDADCNGHLMAVHHRHRPIWGVQFHPESILTPEGGRLIENLLHLVEERRHAA